MSTDNEHKYDATLLSAKLDSVEQSIRDMTSKRTGHRLTPLQKLSLQVIRFARFLFNYVFRSEIAS